ncbi:DUF167 domain-containing protein [Sphingomonas daechungensis]|uniref:UPF0235 protein H9L15_12280 n=1 Tax=Sphingomonas daechungensis TaxID=1176646 RepID=A0ABX6SZU4_9SPHN|nr:DUF167 domain-containing protein [Sphingomonas daechungensis]QNP42834.1 DUF167 domain-containing protein [Sphingomonas daechungensis]
MKSQIAIRVTTRSARPGIGGWRPGADGREELEVRVAEPPADGAANAAVIAMLAKALRLPRGDVRIVSGEASRHKRIGLPLDDAEARNRLSR